MLGIMVLHYTSTNTDTLPYMIHTGAILYIKLLVYWWPILHYI